MNDEFVLTIEFILMTTSKIVISNTFNQSPGKGPVTVAPCGGRGIMELVWDDLLFTYRLLQSPL